MTTKASSPKKRQTELPIYSAKRNSYYPAWLNVTCPREDCGELFLVKASRWYKKRTYQDGRGREFPIVGRSCPYCFAAARLPDRASIR
jgi:hypothetical protein